MLSAQFHPPHPLYPGRDLLHSNIRCAGNKSPGPGSGIAGHPHPVKHVRSAVSIRVLLQPVTYFDPGPSHTAFPGMAAKRCADIQGRLAVFFVYRGLLGHLSLHLPLPVIPVFVQAQGLLGGQQHHLFGHRCPSW